MTAGAQRATLVPDPGSQDAAIPVLAVAAGTEIYGFPLSAVREILIPPPLTEVPRAAKHFLGVITVRGEIVTLVDLSELLSLEERDRQPLGRVILVDVGEELIGVAVDRVVQVAQLRVEFSLLPRFAEFGFAASQFRRRANKEAKSDRHLKQDSTSVFDVKPFPCSKKRESSSW